MFVIGLCFELVYLSVFSLYCRVLGYQ